MLRFAPSPTGDMHIGNLRVALFNYILSKQLNEPLSIRIEDTDRERNIDGKDREILELLNRFSIEYKSLIYQSHNLKFHQQIAMQLLTKKEAFACFCPEDLISQKREDAKSKKEAYRYDGSCEFLSDEEVLNSEKPFVVRLKKPPKAIKFNDKLKGEFEYDPHTIDSFIVLRVDKNPTYNFACAVDDMLMDISLVIRGEDHLSNTPRQIAIRDAIGYEKSIEYIHLPIILNSSGKKMSKRESESSVKWLLSEGYLPSAIANYLILLGNSQIQKEIFTLKDAIEFFDITKISKSPAKFDLDKLRFINREHIRLMDSLELSKEIGFADRDIGELAKLYSEEASTTFEIKSKIDKIFTQTTPDDFVDEIATLKEVIKDLEPIESFDEFKKIAMQKSNLKGKNFFKPLRFILTGEFDGPELSRVYPLLRNYIQRLV